MSSPRQFTREAQEPGFRQSGIHLDVLPGAIVTGPGYVPGYGGAHRPVTMGSSHVEKSAQRRNDQPMNAVPREELDAKLDTIRAEMDGRFMRVEDKIDALAANIADLKGTVVDGAKEQRESRRHQTNVAIAIIATVLASGLALYSSITGTNSLMLSAFQTVLTATQQEPAPPPSSNLPAGQPPATQPQGAPR